MFTLGTVSAYSGDNSSLYTEGDNSSLHTEGTCCHHMMYRKTVVLCNKEKYNKVSCDLLKSIFSADLTRISSDGKEWVVSQNHGSAQTFLILNCIFLTTLLLDKTGIDMEEE